MFERFPVMISTVTASMDAAALVAAATDWGKVGAAAEAQRLSFIAAFAADWLTGAGEDTELCAIDAEDEVIAEIGAAFGISPGWAARDLEIGAAMRERFPRLAALFLEGEVSAKVMATVVDRTVLVCDEQALALIDQACVEAATTCGWSGLSYYKLKNAVDVWVERYDPVAVRRVRAHLRGRCVQSGGTDEKSGTAQVFARLSITGAALLMGRLRKMSKGVCAHDPRTLDQRMADSLEALAADADHLKCLCGSPTCPAAAEDGVASRYVVHLYAEAGAVTVSPDPLIHGDGSGEDVAPGGVTVTYRPRTQQERDAASAAASAAAEKPEPTPTKPTPKKPKPKQCPAPTPAAGEAEPAVEEAEPAEASAVTAEQSAPEFVGLPQTQPDDAADDGSAATSVHPAESVEPATTAEPVQPAEVPAGTAAAESSPVTAPPAMRRVGPPAGIIPGFGIVPASLLAALVAGGAAVSDLQAPPVDPENGYWIPDALREWVKARDLTCRYPGCDRPIEFCDLDHTIAWDDGGPTHASDLKGYCRHHHMMKTFSDGWSEVQFPDGTIMVTTPVGRTYTTKPTSRLLFPNVDTTSAPVERGSPRKQPGGDRRLKMPKRQRSRAKDRAYRIAAERALNAAYLADHTEPPPF
ncbi:hypothetical protein BH10ACT9_BH10ACT9_60830 [soil metagenome]